MMCSALLVVFMTPEYQARPAGSKGGFTSRDLKRLYVESSAHISPGKNLEGHHKATVSSDGRHTTGLAQSWAIPHHISVIQSLNPL